MDRETNQQENPSLLLPNNNNEESPRKPYGGGGGGDRLKRDEWSEGAVSTLLEAYEAKWILRNRAKLKGQDWEDVARFVSSRANCTKSPKTQTQCKNKIESMKKRYRSESATNDASSWPLYPRLDLLLRGSAPPQPPAPSPLQSPTVNHPLMLLESPPPPPQPQPQPQPSQASQLPPQSPHPPPPAAVPPPLPPPAAAPLPPPPLTLGSAQNSHDNGFDRLVKEDGLGGTKVCDGQVSDKNAMETDSSTPALYSDKEKLKSKKMKMRNNDKKKRRRREDWEVSDSIRWLAEVVVRSEQARMDTMREVEKMRVEAEAKRAEMDLKRTEIIANTQLEIARLLSSSGKGVDSSLRIGRS